MSKLYVTHNGKQTPINPDMFVLLYMPQEEAPYVEEFLAETKLDAKFKLVLANIYLKLEDDDHTYDEGEGIKSLVLKMTSEKVLFEYKLSGRQEALLTQIQEYIHASKES